MGHYNSKITEFQVFNFADLSLKTKPFMGKNSFNRQSRLGEKKISINSTDISEKEIWQDKKYQDPGGLKWEKAGVTSSGQVLWGSVRWKMMKPVAVGKQGWRGEE